MANDIKQKIVLEGEKEYNKALSEAKRNLKTLRSELKAETAELGANATAQQKNETRIKSLQKQIKEQEKIVKTYKDALKEVKDKSGDNEDAVAKWEQKLNDARTSLANMKNELDNVGKSFKDVQGSADMATVASRSVAESLGSLADIGGAISDGIESAFMGLLETAKQAVSEIWSMIADTAAKANNWTDLASYYGTTAEEIERMNKAIEWTQGNFGDFTNLLNQLAWGGKNKKITEWFGVSDANYEDKLEYAQVVLQRMSELAKENPQKLGDAMEDIFGAKKSQQIMWFVSNLDQINANLEEYDKKGYGIGKDALSEMNDVWMELGKIEGKWTDMKQQFAAGFGTTTLTIMANVEGSIDALNAYMNAGTPEEREQALKDIEANITSMFTTAANAINEGIKALDKVAKDLQGSDNPTAKALGTVLSGLVAALKWFTEDNMNNVVKALEILAGFWVAGKGLKMAATIAQVAANLKTIALTKIIGGSVGETIGTSAGTSFLSTLKEGLPAVFGAALIAAGFSWAANQRNNNKKDVRGTEENLEERSGNANDLLLKYIMAQQDMSDIDIMNAAPELVEKLTQQVTDTYNALMASENGEEALKAYSDWRQERAYGNMDWVLPDYMSEEEETVNLDEKSAEIIGEAIQDWWDAQRNAQNGVEDYNEAWKALDWMQEVLGDDFGAVYDNIIRKLDELDSEQQLELDEIPASWWQHQGGNAGNQDGMTSEDAKSMTGAVQQMPKAVAKALSGMTVRLDGQTVGYIVAPYVSQQIAAQIGG